MVQPQGFTPTCRSEPASYEGFAWVIALRSSGSIGRDTQHRRTLTRRLSAFDTGFQELVDEIRFEIARQMLEDTRMEIPDISALLDYAGPNAFTRAFRRWSGTTPAKWRTKTKGNG